MISLTSFGCDIGGAQNLSIARKNGSSVSFEATSALYYLEVARADFPALRAANIEWHSFSDFVFMVVGESALRAEKVVGGKASRIRPYRDLMSPREKFALEIILKSIFAQLPYVGNQIVCSVHDRFFETGYEEPHTVAFARILGTLGYLPTFYGSAYAMLKGMECGTGFGIVMDDESVNVCVKKMSVPVFSCSFARARSYIELQSALNASSEPDVIHSMLASKFNLAEPSSYMEQIIADWYSNLLMYVFNSVGSSIGLSNVSELPVFFSGGLCQLDGFADLARAAYGEANPFPTIPATITVVSPDKTAIGLSLLANS